MLLLTFHTVHNLWSELEKIAASSEMTPEQKAKRDERIRKAKRRGMIATGTAAGLLAGGAASMAALPGMRANLKAVAKSGGWAAARKADTAKPLHPAAIAEAKRVAAKIRESGIDTKNIRIAVSGTGGTGKSSTARALAKELGLPVHDLDGKDLRKMRGNISPGIYEQTHLTTEVDPSRFQVVMHLRKPQKEVDKQILKRGRGAWQHDFYDNKRISNAIKNSVDELGGKEHRVSKVTRIKIAPQGGFKSEDPVARTKRLRKGVGYRKGELSRRQYFKTGKAVAAATFPIGTAAAAGMGTAAATKGEPGKRRRTSPSVPRMAGPKIPPVS